ncbi:hypothetical protein B0O80DRAFT_486729 [Mortierella sp. GBAus27b]|nr:hypothetical protein B0O80DRAFT_486729 [Mortierella sp. GBAus27b]
MATCLYKDLFFLKSGQLHSVITENDPRPPPSVAMVYVLPGWLKDSTWRKTAKVDQLQGFSSSRGHHKEVIHNEAITKEVHIAEAEVTKNTAMLQSFAIKNTFGSIPQLRSTPSSVPINTNTLQLKASFSHSRFNKVLTSSPSSASAYSGKFAFILDLSSYRHLPIATLTDLLAIIFGQVKLRDVKSLFQGYVQVGR